MSDAPVDLADAINGLHEGTWAGRMGLSLLRATPDEVVAEMDVTPDHLQPQGLVHGGVFASIVESLASVGASVVAYGRGMNVVGLENHTSFVRAVRGGKLRATATPLTRGRRSQLWEVVIRDGDDRVAATGRVRLLVLEPDSQVAGAELGKPDV